MSFRTIAVIISSVLSVIIGFVLGWQIKPEVSTPQKDKIIEKVVFRDKVQQKVIYATKVSKIGNETVVEQKKEFVVSDLRTMEDLNQRMTEKPVHVSSARFGIGFEYEITGSDVKKENIRPVILMPVSKNFQIFASSDLTLSSYSMGAVLSF